MPDSVPENPGVTVDPGKPGVADGVPVFPSPIEPEEPDEPIPPAEPVGPPAPVVPAACAVEIKKMAAAAGATIHLPCAMAGLLERFVPASDA